VQEVKQELARRQGSADTQPITDADAEFVYQEAQHARQFKQLQQAKEESLPTPDFEACRAALPRVKLLPADFDSSSGSVEQRAERLLEAVLPRQPSDDHFAAVAAQKQQAQPAQQKQKKASKAATVAAAAAAGAGSSASATYQQAVRVAYEKAWGEQLAALEENLELIEEEGLGKVRYAVNTTALYSLLAYVYLSTASRMHTLRIQEQAVYPCYRSKPDDQGRHHDGMCVASLLPLTLKPACCCCTGGGGA
jgi:hypothetical protein